MSQRQIYLDGTPPIAAYGQSSLDYCTLTGIISRAADIPDIGAISSILGTQALTLEQEGIIASAISGMEEIKGPLTDLLYLSKLAFLNKIRNAIIYENNRFVMIMHPDKIKRRDVQLVLVDYDCECEIPGKIATMLALCGDPRRDVSRQSVSKHCVDYLFADSPLEDTDFVPRHGGIRFKSHLINAARQYPQTITMALLPDFSDAFVDTLIHNRDAQTGNGRRRGMATFTSSIERAVAYANACYFEAYFAAVVPFKTKVGGPPKLAVFVSADPEEVFDRAVYTTCISANNGIRWPGFTTGRLERIVTDGTTPPQVKERLASERESRKRENMRAREARERQKTARSGAAYRERQWGSIRVNVL